MEEYLVPTKAADAEFTQQRSRFIGHIFPVEDEGAALALLKQTRETYWNASHNVYAYIIHGGATRYSDDSEPQGTAGMPVLDVLRKTGLENVLCIVTRYFGGILLGAGGLVRAYTKSASLAVEAAGISKKQVWVAADVPCPYALYERLRREVSEHGGLVTDAEFGAEVLLHVLVPRTAKEDFLAGIVDASLGQVKGIILGEEYRAFPVERQAADEHP